MATRLSDEQYRQVNSLTRYLLAAMPKDLKTFGERVRFARKDVGLTQVQLAAKANIGQSALSSIENGETKWSRGPTLLHLAVALDVSATWLETGSGSMRANLPIADYQFGDLLQALSAENRRRLMAVGQALLADQTAHTRPSSQDPYPHAPKPPLRAKKATV